MAYETERRRIGRRPMIIVDLELDTGTERFSTISGPVGMNVLPIISSVSLTPTRLRPGKGLGDLATISISIEDFKYGPAGHYISKLVASNPYYNERVMRVWVGYYSPNGFSMDDFSERLYFIDEINGPDGNGKWTITGKGALKSLYDSGSMVPPVTKGVTTATIGASYTGPLDITDVSGFESSGIVWLADECARYSGVSGTSITLTDRGIYGTAAVLHDPGTAARMGVDLGGMNVVDAIDKIVTEYGRVDPAYIPSADWALERDDFLPLYILSGPLRDPQKVADVVNKLATMASLNIWWDEIGQQVRLNAYGSQIISDFTITDKKILSNASGTSVRRDLKDRLTQVWYSNGKIDHSKDSKSTNFRDVYVAANLILEGPAFYGSPAVLEIKGDFITSSAVAAAVSGRMLGRRKHGRTTISFSMDAKDAAISTGDIGFFISDLIQQGKDDPSPGSPKRLQVIITSVSEEDGHSYKYEAEVFRSSGSMRYCLIAPTATVDYSDATDEVRLKYGFISNNDPAMPNGDDPYVIA